MAKSSSSPDLPPDLGDLVVVDKPAKEAPKAKGKPTARDKKDKKTDQQRSKQKDRSQKKEDTEGEPLDLPTKGFIARFFDTTAGWMTSLIVHMVLIIVLALIALPIPESIDSLLSSVQSEEVSDDVVDVPQVDLSEIDVEITPQEITEQPDTDVIEDVVNFDPFQDELAAAAPVELADFSLTSAPEAITSGTAMSGDALSGRGHQSRAKLVREGGGNAESEAAVEAALAWLAQHQNRDGTWHIDHRGGGDCQGQCGNPGDIKESYKSATALALLPYLGAGQTRFDGKYKSVVGRGLDALVRLGERPRQGAGVSWVDGGNMYAHGLSSIALCEAYGMTGESQLALPAQTSIDYIVSAQNPNDGGWRYSFQSPGDTSVVGWQIMALKSAHLAQLNVPHSTVMGASRFLDFAQQDEYGSAYAYTTDNKANYRPSTSAVGLLCRMYLGWKRDNQALADGVAKIAEIGPSSTDFYYNYYAAQLIFQFTNGRGPMWRQWNEKLRDFLVRTQEKEGHAKGSWFVSNGHDTSKGGRLYCTAMACMTLEVYYRHMPIYRADAVEMEFPE